LQIEKKNLEVVPVRKKIAGKISQQRRLTVNVGACSGGKRHIVVVNREKNKNSCSNECYPEK